jgi:NAD(P)-dependent dehydrogenase (short-subunit alcohol dehydrogenase family)
MENLLDLFRLDGMVAVVTGSGRGIGRGIAIGLADAGADVLVTARRADDVDEVVGQIRARGRRAVAMPGDIRDFSEDLAQAAVDQLGRLDIWVNNVGGSEDKAIQPLAETSDEIFRNQLELNLTAAFQGAKAAANRMGRGGSIINIASGAGMTAAPNTGPYGAAKAGMINLTMTLSQELAPQGIRVNAISPGMVPTEAFHQVLGITDAELPEFAAKVPLGRLGTPEDMAAAVVYFASPAASWVTGQNILISGGRQPGRSAEGRH